MASPPSGGLVAFRIASGRYPLLDGGGAARVGGRWNAKGQRVIYAGLSFAGALLEQLAHAGIGRLPRDHRWIEIQLPADARIETLDVDPIPGWWKPDSRSALDAGDRWFRAGRALALIVPSVVGRPVERNLLINQEHSDFARVVASRPKPVIWDERLFTPRVVRATRRRRPVR
jgi:RES domain-containing protein